MDRIFGSQVRTDVLVTVARFGTTYVSEIARILGRRPVEVQRAVASLELAGVVQSRRVGTIRTVELNKRFPEYRELSNLLVGMSERPNYTQRWKALRRRPRAMGKAL
jgi:predicted transcriptional regulator